MKIALIISFLIFLSDSGDPKSVKIDPLDAAINKTIIEGNRLKADMATQNQTIAVLLMGME